MRGNRLSTKFHAWRRVGPRWSESASRGLTPAKTAQLGKGSKHPQARQEQRGRTRLRDRCAATTRAAITASGDGDRGGVGAGFGRPVRERCQKRLIGTGKLRGDGSDEGTGFPGSRVNGCSKKVDRKQGVQPRSRREIDEVEGRPRRRASLSGRGRLRQPAALKAAGPKAVKSSTTAGAEAKPVINKEPEVKVAKSRS